MKKNGFTLIEMMIVLLIIAVLIMITIPNVAKNNQSVRNKGCDAMVKLVEAQVQAYLIDEESLPASLGDLQQKGYIKETKCPNGVELKYDAKTGEVTGNEEETATTSG